MFEIYTLDYGLRVVTEYIEHVNSVSVGVMVQNGSRNEDNSGGCSGAESGAEPFKSCYGYSQEKCVDEGH